MNALPNQCLELLVNSARREIEDFGFLPTANIPISLWTVSELRKIPEPTTDIWQPKGDLRAKSIQDWEGATVTAENFGKDLVPCAKTRKFQTVPRILVVTFGTLGTHRLEKLR